MKRRASLIDLTWLEDGDTYKPESKKNNIKPELQAQWGYERIAPVYETNSAGSVARHTDDTGIPSGVIVFARNRMNKGDSFAKAKKAAIAKFGRSAIASSNNQLNKLSKYDGVIGRFVLDSRGYPSCRMAMKSLASSPYKKFIKFVIGCHCGEPMFVEDSRESIAVRASSGDMVTDFLASDKHEKKFIACCRKTMIPIFAHQDIDEEFVDKGIVEIAGHFGLSDEDVETIRSAKVSPLKRLKMAFCMVDQKNEVEVPDIIEDRTGLVVEPSENIIEINPEPKPAPVVVLNDDRLSDISIPRKPVTPPSVPVGGLVPKLHEIDIPEAPKDDGEELHFWKNYFIKPDEKVNVPSSNVNMRQDDFIVETQPLFGEVEVDLSPVLEKEFKETGIIDVDAPKKVDPVVVDMKGDFTW